MDIKFENPQMEALADADGRFLDAVRVGERGSARLGAEGPWRVPTAATPGTENEVDVDGDVVITELAYHRSPISEEGVPFEEPGHLLVAGFAGALGAAAGQALDGDEAGAFGCLGELGIDGVDMGLLDGNLVGECAGEVVGDDHRGRRGVRLLHS